MSGNDLVGVAEMVTVLGRSKVTVIRYTRRPDFPAPVAELASGRVWRREDVLAWAALVLPVKTGRRAKVPRDG